MKNQFVFFRIVVWAICIYHLTLGILFNCSLETINWALTDILGATKTPDSSTLLLIRMLGGYMIFFGAGMALTAWNPVKNRSFLSLGAGLVVLRSIQRIIQSDDLNQTLGLSSQVNWIAIAILLVFAALLLTFRFALYKDGRNISND